jgi:flagellar protein FlaD
MFRRKKKRVKEEPKEEEIVLEEVKPEELEEGMIGLEEKKEEKEEGMIGLEEKKEEKEEGMIGLEEKKEEKEEGMIGLEEEYMTSEEIEREVNKLRGKVPSFILKDLKASLEGRSVTKSQFDKISEAILEKVDRSRLDKRIEDMSTQVTKLTDTIESIGKLMGKKPVEERAPVRELPIEIPVRKIEVKLTQIPSGPTSSRLLLKWLGFLMERIGYEGCIEALNHYVDIGWISEDVFIDLSKVVRSLGTHWQAKEKPVGYLTPTDHMRSLLFIEELQGKRREAIEEA